MQRQLTGLVLITGGVAASVAWAMGRVTHPFVPVVGLFLFLAGASLFGKTNQLAEQLRPFVGRRVRVAVWGIELPGPGNEATLHSVRTLGAGLHFYLRSPANGLSVHLKIAQPRDVQVTSNGIEIQNAKYVQCGGRRVAKVAGTKAIVLRSAA